MARREPARGDTLNDRRVRRLIDQAAGTFRLDLRDLVVLTEAATGYYALTPLIAAIGGAAKVLALARDSRFGSGEDVARDLMQRAEAWGVADRMAVLTSRSDHRLADVDVVTNLGMVRPIDADLLARLGPHAAVALMWETWEYRPEDLDLAACRRLGVPVLGTDEHHASLRIFDYIGELAVKLLHQLEIEVFRSQVVVLGSGEFAQSTRTALASLGAEVTGLDQLTSDSLRDASARTVASADALVVVEHHKRHLLVGPDGDLDLAALADLNPGLALAHICGGIDAAAIRSAGMPLAPEHIARAGYMSVATDFLGPRPLIDLHAAGLSIGAELSRARARGAGAAEAEASVLKSVPFAQAFATSEA